MKILIIADEEWNDVVFGNGVLTNWFTGFDAEFAEIYYSPGLPLNNVCNRYFQLTDGLMMRSLPYVIEHVHIRSLYALFIVVLSAFTFSQSSTYFFFWENVPGYYFHPVGIF